MAALAQFDPNVHKDIGASKITGVFETKIFYLIRGRNAWHATWVQHYFDRCMHDDLQSAKDRAEQMRERGSVFTIREQPALAFRAKGGLVLITEINTHTPLSDWIKKHKSKRSDHQLDHDYCRLETLFRRNRTIQTETLVGSLDDWTIFPDHPPGHRRNFFVLVTPDTDALHEDHRNRLKRWQSSSAGAYYHLQWSERPEELSSRAVRRVADALTKCIGSRRLRSS